MITLAENFRALEQRVNEACKQAGREPGSVNILPVTKTFSPDTIRMAIDLGYHRFAENKAQELKEKAIELQDYDQLQWVIIGYLQTNKSKEVATYASEIQSLDRIELAKALDNRLQAAGKSIKALVQVKTSPEVSKTGLEISEVPAFLNDLKESGIQTLDLQGFMTIAENTENQDDIRKCFSSLRELAERCRDITGLALPQLSMGMSGDFEIAIQEGATEIRIGHALFGERNKT
ncbi:YggS family pyridoxal phosphate-dependent enzyme [Taylorella equigenitalis]|uniref:Pyridoxal phosphate homeostasis protein n=3 Tax=Taylorella equigenitalis TaxID=29575 RepID=A0A654KG95_TAYEM|nr:YggS family pyridoxal phosphate-dependent enzyme [Taylorella equigenitalis]ADU91441.1 Hypothetical protein YggS [Taylorella equigenitalis MCE9]AFN36527.1 putative pyridoxal phosphate dependent enzyme [Taylorella equigenitalis ATCC 35865]ASY31093.1 YggS family pyridoxal phosphate enzyme [Taylorella equigenitalis]ASY38395.1 YggS family pyridoxal phosphate enzyme [Taylorella equigenitalis]ASY39927.1 YggS family pyridoxal phosphate enzyme [Taylorella equigenitalis]